MTKRLVISLCCYSYMSILFVLLCWLFIFTLVCHQKSFCMFSCLCPKCETKALTGQVIHKQQPPFGAKISWLGYLSADIICSEKQTVFQERSSRKLWASRNRTNLWACFHPKWRLLCLLSFKYFFAAHGTKFLWTAYCQKRLLQGCWLFGVLWYDFMNKQVCIFLCNNSKTLSHLESILK